MNSSHLKLRAKCCGMYCRLVKELNFDIKKIVEI